MLSPVQVTEYLKALKAEKVASGRLVLGEGAEINVIFAPEMDEMPGEAPTAGGWKGPEKLDDHSTFDLPPSVGEVAK